VKLATHKKNGSRVAIKTVKKKDMSAIEVYQQRREIEVLKMCQHPNIIKLIDLFENADYYYIVLEYMEGKDLFDYLKARSFNIPEERAKEIALQLMVSTQYLHSYGIVHRDLKLENVMMTDCSDRALPKLVDFGLAKIIGPSEKADEPFGTLGYVAPEVLKKDPYTFSCDMWSIGCITYALLSGSLPFDDDSQKETIRKTLHQPLEFDLPVWTSVSTSAKDFVSGLLLKDQHERLTMEKAMNHKWIKDSKKK
jgi:serine/threonine protein kinase